MSLVKPRYSSSCMHTINYRLIPDKLTALLFCPSTASSPVFFFCPSTASSPFVLSQYSEQPCCFVPVQRAALLFCPSAASSPVVLSQYSEQPCCFVPVQRAAASEGPGRRGRPGGRGGPRQLLSRLLSHAEKLRGRRTHDLRCSEEVRAQDGGLAVKVEV